MKWYSTKTIAILGAILLAATLVLAQEGSTSSQQQSHPMTQMSMMQMMGGRQMGSMHAAIADLDKVVTQALQSNDPTRMKTALQEVQTRLTQWEEHMQGCPMATGKGMHSGMQGMQNSGHAAHHSSQPQQQ